MGNRKLLINSRRRRQQQQKTLAMILVVVGIAILAFGFSALSGKELTGEPLDYQPQDIVSDFPLHAVHEMEPSSAGSIPFLPKEGPQPEIKISEVFYDFGSIGPTEVAKHDFIIANHGDAPLTIYRAYTTCGCTTADFTSTVIPPGKVAIMTLILDAGFHDARGQTVRRGVIIENNDPNNSQIEIWSQAKVRINP